MTEAVKIVALFFLITLLNFSNVWAFETDKEDFSKGVVYANNGQFDEAILEFTKVIKINPKDAIAYYNRGKAYSL